MPNIGALLDEATGMGEAILSDHGYAIAYGSHVSATGSPHSDLDLLYVTNTKAPLSARRQLASEVIDLHHRHRLRLDVEVRHEVKLTATATDVANAVTLAAFTSNDQARLHVPAVRPTAEFLNSTQFHQRLILGALTGPHVFIAGHLPRYRRDCEAATRAIAVLSSAMLADRPTLTYTHVRSALLTHPTGADGKDHLGYQSGIAIEHLTRSVLAELIAMRIITHLSATTFDHRHPVTSNLLLWPRSKPTTPGIALPA